MNRSYMHGEAPSRAARILLAALWCAIALAALTPSAHAALGTQIAANQYGYPYPNAPDCNEYGSGGCVADAWNFYQGQCTSWTAYRLNQLNGVAFRNNYGGGQWGDASNWGAKARSMGIPVNGTPAVGAVVWYASGHVGYVEQVISPTQVVMSEMNYDLHNGFRMVTISTANRWPSGFIHVHDRPTGPPPPPAEGSFINVPETGRVYRIVGGAPLYVSNWAVYGGAQPTTPVSAAQLAQMRNVPADGTFVHSQQTGRVYRIAGGAPIYVSSWSVVGGPQPTIGIDQWAIDQASRDENAHLYRVPADGTFINSTATGRVYKIVGGAPTYVSNWAAVGGPQPSVGVDQWAIDRAGDIDASHLNSVPADNTLINSTATGRVYRIAGGAPVYISNWDAIGGAQPSTGIDEWAVAMAGKDPNSHLNDVPAEGTFVRSTQTGRIYRIAGGAPLYVTSFGVFGSRGEPYVDLDEWAFANAGRDAHAHMNAYPADGTFLNGMPRGAVYRVAGGAAFPLSSWSLFGGVQPYADADEWNVFNTQEEFTHLRPVAADGTLIKGLPSGQGWVINGGRKSRADVTSASVAIDDLAIAAIPDAEGQVAAGPAGGRAPSQSGSGSTSAGPSKCALYRAAIKRDLKRISALKRKQKRARTHAARRSASKAVTKAKKRLKLHRARARRACR